MIKTFKIRLFPTAKQITAMNETLVICCKVYNKTLLLRKTEWEVNSKFISLFDTHKFLPIWKKEDEELSKVYSSVLQEVQDRVDFSFRQFFKKVKSRKNKNSYPKLKETCISFSYPTTLGVKLLNLESDYKESYRVLPNGYVKRIKKTDKISLSKIGLVNCSSLSYVQGKLLKSTVIKDKLSNWYCLLICEVEEKVLEPSTEIVGIDLGIRNFATLSTGEVIKQQSWMKQKEKELNKANKKLKLLEKGSADYKKQLKVINHIFTKIMNKRKDFSHKESRKLVDRFGLIVFEDLDIQSMLKANPRSLNDKILDVGWGKFVSNTEYKAKEAGRGFILIDPRNTSKLCSTCGTLVSKSLSTRIHNCPNCGLTIDRDLNASYNILARGLASL